MADFTILAGTAAAQHGLLTRGQLERAGLTRNHVAYQVKLGRFRRLSPGLVVVGGAPDTWSQRVAAASLGAQPLGAASHRSAAQLWGWRTVDNVVEVVVRYPRRLALRGAIVHRSVDLIEDDITWVDGIPTTTIERTLCDLGLTFPESEVMRILRHAVSAGAGDARVTGHDVSKLRKRISERGRNGAGVIRRCLDLLPQLAERTESGLEVMFLEICERFGLPRPRIQVPVSAQGRTYRLDFAYVAERVAIEIDGKSKHSEPTQIAADGGRQNALVAAGWQPIRFDYDKLLQAPQDVAATIRRLLPDL